MILIPSSLNFIDLFNDCKVDDAVVPTHSNSHTSKQDKSCFTRQVGHVSPFSTSPETTVEQASCDGKTTVVYGDARGDPIATLTRVDGNDKTFKIAFFSERNLTAQVTKKGTVLIIDIPQENSTFKVYREVPHPFHQFPNKYCITHGSKTVASTREDTVNNTYMLTITNSEIDSHLIKCLAAIADELQ